jgi:hypothetical protein
MIDTTHAGLPSTLATIKALPSGSLVGLYDTGSSNILATAADIASIPSIDHVVMIDQGFTGSPNLKATVRDCENGAWLVSKAVNKAGWNVPRPTLYLGFPDTAQQAFDAGWRGDVWLVHSSSTPPTSPPVVPAGLNVVAVQWNFGNPNFDVSIVFDDTWPNAKTPADPPGITVGSIPNFWTGKGVCIVRGSAPGDEHLWVTTSEDLKTWTKVQGI